MHFNEFTRFGFNPIIKTTIPDDFFDLEKLKNIYNVLNDLCPNSCLSPMTSFDKNFSYRDVCLTMINKSQTDPYLFNFNILDFDSITFRHFIDEYFSSGFINLHDFYKQKECTQIYEPLIYVLKKLLNYISVMPSYHTYGDCISEEINVSLDMYGFSSCGYVDFPSIIENKETDEEVREVLEENYPLCLEIHEEVIPFVNYIKSFDKKFTNKEILERTKDSEFSSFVEASLDFLENPTSTSDFSIMTYLNDEDYAVSFMYYNCFLWKSDSYVNDFYHDCLNQVLNYSGIEIPPLIEVDINKYDSKEVKSKKDSLVKLKKIHNIFKKDSVKKKLDKFKEYSFNNIGDFDLISLKTDSLSKEFSVLWKVKSSKRLFVYKDDVNELIYPNMVFKLTDKEFFVYAYKKWNGNKTLLYNIPLPNFYPNNRMCFGNINFNFNDTDISRMMSSAEKSFFNSSFNSFESSNRTKSSTIKIIKESIKNCTPIPSEEFVSSKNKIKDVLSR